MKKIVTANILVYYACCSVISPLQSVREKYQSNEYQEDNQKQTLVFEKDEIVLDLPTFDPKLKVVDGWKIRPLTYPQVKMPFLIHNNMRDYTCLPIIG